MAASAASAASEEKAKKEEEGKKKKNNNNKKNKRKKKRRRRRRTWKGRGVTPLWKSRDPHLAGGERYKHKHVTYMIFFQITRVEACWNHQKWIGSPNGPAIEGQVPESPCWVPWPCFHRCPWCAIRGPSDDCYTWTQWLRRAWAIQDAPVRWLRWFRSRWTTETSVYTHLCL